MLLRTRARTRSAVLVALTLLLGAVWVGPAAADSTSPRLRSAAMQSDRTLGPGQDLVLEAQFDDADEPGSGVSYAQFDFELFGQNGLVAAMYLQSRDENGQGRIQFRQQVGQWAAAGTYRLQRILVVDSTGNGTRYYRNGTVDSYPNSTTAPPPASLDFSSFDVDVVNPQGDSAIPVVTEVELLTPRVRAGEPVVVRTRTDDDLSGVFGVTVHWRSNVGQTVNATSFNDLRASGLGSALVPPGAEGGAWTASAVTLRDHAGNGATYHRDDATSPFGPLYQPTGVRPHRTQPPIDWPSFDLHVDAAAPDTAAPDLSAVSRESAAVLRPGDDIVFGYTVADQSPLIGISFSLRDSHGHQVTVDRHCLPEASRAVGEVPLGFTPGPVVVDGVSVVDAQYNQVFYRRDGQALDSTRPNYTHGLDLSRLDFRVEAGEASSNGLSSTSPGCVRTPDLTLQAPDAVPPGSDATIGGVVKTATGAALVGATVAVLSGDTDEPADAAALNAAQLITTDSDGRWSVTRRIDSDHAFRARFLGRAGQAGADPGSTGTIIVRADSGRSPSPSPEPTSSPEPSSSPAPAPSPTPTTSPAPTPPPSGSPAPTGDPATSSPASSLPNTAPLAVSVSPASINAGQQVTVTYRGRPHETVDVLSRTQPATRYSRIVAVTLDQHGYATTTHRPQRNTRLTAVRSDGTRSSEPLVQVRSVTTINSLRVGPRAYRFTGRVYPARNQRVVSLYRAGRLFAQGRTGPDGVYAITKTMSPGTTTLTARSGHDTYNLGSTSRTLKLTPR